MTQSATFVAPGPGGWDLDRSHYFGGTTPISQWLMTEGCEAGMRRAFAEFGVPADTLQARFVHGFMYTRLRPLVAPDKPAVRAPPTIVLKVASRLHPEFRRRTRAASRTLAERPWRRVVAEWSQSIRPELERANLAYQQVEPADLDDAELADHLHDLLEHLRATFEQHFYLHAFDLGPIGMLLYEGRAWGLSATDLVPALEGASPSTGAPARALGELRALVSRAGTLPTSLEELRALSPEVTRALDEYLHLRGWVMFSRYDLDGLTLHEAPAVLLATVLAATNNGHGNSGPAGAGEAASALRERVPAASRARFDELLSEARAAMDLRDGNGPNTVEWPIGLLRRALLAAGDRLVTRGAVHDSLHLLELEAHEVVPLVRSGEGPSAEELSGRRHRRLELARMTPPAHLGPVEVEPALSALPAPLATMVGVVNAVVAEMGMGAAGAAAAANEGLCGVGVGSVPYRGRARIAVSPEEAFCSMEPGDVLVVRATSPAYNMVLSLAGAVVTADGGPLSHAAVLARELGIPAVVGAASALEIPDGAQVEVDPVAGRVTVL